MTYVMCDATNCENHDGEGCTLELINLNTFWVIGNNGISKPDFPTCNDFEERWTEDDEERWTEDDES